jgi:mono/diheme cytochrome c family protein
MSAPVRAMGGRASDGRFGGVRAAGTIAAILCGCLFGSAWADEPVHMGRNTDAGQTGAEIYTNICQGCHMPQGQGAVGAGHYPKLAGDDDLKGRLGELVVASVVLKGRNGMPAFGMPTGGRPEHGVPVLNDAQVAEIVNYVRTHFGNEYREKITAAEVAKLQHPVSMPGL